MAMSAFPIDGYFCCPLIQKSASLFSFSSVSREETGLIYFFSHHKILSYFNEAASYALIQSYSLFSHLENIYGKYYVIRKSHQAQSL
jgi:hypothetical protein